MKKGQCDEAMTHFRKALRVSPNYADAHYNMGVALATKGRIDDAMTHYRKALEIDANHAETHNDMGVAIANSGRVDEAMIHFRKALEIKPRLFQAHGNLGVALFNTGRRDKAIKIFAEPWRSSPILPSRTIISAKSSPVRAVSKTRSGTFARCPKRTRTTLGHQRSGLDNGNLSRWHITRRQRLP